MIITQPTVNLADPHICTDATDKLNILNAIFDTLVTRDDKQPTRFIPALAKAWTVSSDARQWAFTLRNDIHFHNGARMSAADVVASLHRACDPSVGGELGTEGVWASYLGRAVITSADPQTVTVTVDQSLADLLDLLVAIPILPQAVCTQDPADLSVLYVGTGPWKLTARSHEEVVLGRFEQSWARQPQTNGPLIFRAQPDRAMRAEDLLSERVDIATKLSAANAPQIEQGGKRLLTQSSNLCVAFLLNASSGPCHNKHFRQAINYAVNVQRMIDGGSPGAQPLNGPLSSHHFGTDPTLAPYPHDPARAKELLEQAGVGSSITIDLPTTLPDEAPLLGDLLAEDLAAVGIDVTLRHFEDRVAYAHMVKAKEIDDACCFDSSPLSTYRVLREKLNSDVAGPWWQGYANPRVNQLLDQASATPSDATRQTIYHRAYGTLHDDAPWLFLYQPANFWGVGNVAVQPTSEGVLQFT